MRDIISGTGSDAGRTFNSAYDYDFYNNPYYQEESDYANAYYNEGYSSSQPLPQDSSHLQQHTIPNPYASEVYNKATHYVNTVLEELRICTKSGKSHFAKFW